MSPFSHPAPPTAPASREPHLLAECVQGCAHFILAVLKAILEKMLMWEALCLSVSWLTPLEAPLPEPVTPPLCSNPKLESPSRSPCPLPQAKLAESSLADQACKAHVQIICSHSRGAPSSPIPPQPHGGTEAYTCFDIQGRVYSSRSCLRATP